MLAFNRTRCANAVFRRDNNGVSLCRADVFRDYNDYVKAHFRYKKRVDNFLATSLLSFILVTDKECMMMYVIFFGYYPIVREYFTKIKNKAFRIITKLTFFNIMMILCQVILIKIFGIPFLEDGQGKSFIIVFALLMNLLFLVYELMIEKVTLLYIYKLEKRIKKIFK